MGSGQTDKDLNKSMVKRLEARGTVLDDLVSPSVRAGEPVCEPEWSSRLESGSVHDVPGECVVVQETSRGIFHGVWADGQVYQLRPECFADLGKPVQAKVGVGIFAKAKDDLAPRSVPTRVAK